MPTPDISDDTTRLLAGAAAFIAQCPVCWLTTPAGEARPMGPIGRKLDAENWTLSFVTDGRSAKIAALRPSREASLLFQRDDAFAQLIGKADLIEDRAEVARRWRPAYDPYFPTAEDHAHAIFLDLRIARMNLWIRGVTAEPFGLRTTTLQRDGAGWRRL